MRRVDATRVVGPYHLLTQKGKTYNEMQEEFANACPYHLIL